MVFYGDPVLETGEFQRCYVYATISGRRNKGVGAG
jgi:hypothetical protein